MAAFGAKRVLWRSFSTVASHPLRVCIVGSGPAGFYTAEKMLKTHQGSQVDIIDRLPTPYGLVRSGVAPDHPETKYLKGVHSAREFVWWYNGHPDGRNLDPDLKSPDTAVILGQGNVALDVARILLHPTSELATTDIASHALTALEQSSIRKVYLVGRRGPVQAACTAKELREVLGIKDLYIHIKEADLKITPADEEEMKNSRIHRRIYELLSKAATTGPSQPSTGQRELHFVFFRQPDRFLESYDKNGYVSGVNLEKTALKGVGSGKQIAIGTGQFENLSCGIVLKSIGYKSVPVDGLPFDNQKGVVPNVKGRVLSDNSGDPTSIENGLYVCGWLKRGPTGIIGTNLYCAEETVESVSEDLEQGVLASTSSPPKLGRDGLLRMLEDRNVRVVPFGGWERIDNEEKRLGNLRNKPREKLTRWEELLEAASE
ncbi:NADPH:adrenodoxin oxidoreductase, mitochondrial isoform X2 [Hibiscus syriacus]|uniref:NADPH:adrenodoxin oxidoreductase, mitochondrial isoform X2 n=1 Tax=Hibiscus syriacus TaxID=106335 RepID=UPI001921FA10|nr:NADPH:adrenodoxin oxidoreductase, mitochondrial isoform X2 [Hibiscus syriacus]